MLEEFDKTFTNLFTAIIFFEFSFNQCALEGFHIYVACTF